MLLGTAALGATEGRAGAPPVKADPGLHAWGLLQYGDSYLRIKPASPETAVRYYERAAATGIAWVMYDVAERYRKGAGIAKNPGRALVLYKAVLADDECTPASQTCAWAKFQVGQMLRKGEGDKRDPVLARSLLEEAVQLTDNQWPKLALAELLAESADRDAERRAFRLYWESAAAGNAEAREGLSSLCHRLGAAECQRAVPASGN